MKLRWGGDCLEEAQWGVAELGPDLYTLHGQGGAVIRSGANSPDVLGIGSDRLLGNGFIGSVHVHDRVAVAKALGDCMSTGEPASAQFRLALPQGDLHGEKWFEMRCVAIDAGNGRRVIATTRDVSAHRALEEELRANRERAESASVAKGLFLANMSHELRTPLNAILGFSELLQSDAMASMPPERGREYIQLIHSSAGHLLNVLNDILDMSKIEAGKYEIIAEPFDLAQTLHNCCSMMRGQAEGKAIAIRCDLASDIPEITADERAVKQIVINLLSNAVKFSHEGGDVIVTANRVGRNVRVAIRDRGIGISQEHLGNLGKPFYQADSRYDRKYQGTGLGLSVVRGLVELHRGKLVIESRKGEGTNVVVTLPLNAADSKPVPASEQIDVVRFAPAPEENEREEFSIARAPRASAVGGMR